MFFNTNVLEDELYLIGEFNLFDYKHGRCHLFAMALKNFLTNKNIYSDIVSFMELDDPDVNEICLDHAFIKLKNNKNEFFYFDASGISSLEIISNNYTNDSFDSVLFNESDFLSWYLDQNNKGFIFSYNLNEENNLLKFFHSIFTL